MNDFGNTLRQFRERAGMTTADVAAKTHMIIQQVEDLEHENFNRIAAPIYGRGFVKLYCNAVGIDDPRPFINEFMEIYSGNRESVIQMKESVHSQPADKKAELVQTAEPAPAASAPLVDKPQVGEDGKSGGNENADEENVLFAQEELKHPVHTEEKVGDLPERSHLSKKPARFNPVVPGKGFSGSYDSLMRYKKPLLRCSALVIVLVAVLWALVAGVRAAYRALTIVEDTAMQSVIAAPSKTEKQPQAGNTDVKAPSATKAASKVNNIPPVPPLYID